MLVLTSRIDQAHRPGNLRSRKDVGPIDGLSSRHRFNPIILKCLLTMDGLESEGRSGIRRRLICPSLWSQQRHHTGDCGSACTLEATLIPTGTPGLGDRPNSFPLPVINHTLAIANILSSIR
jgi:hypothetical protein